jgi:hypothetical protein
MLNSELNTLGRLAAAGNLMEGAVPVNDDPGRSVTCGSECGVSKTGVAELYLR